MSRAPRTRRGRPRPPAWSRLFEPVDIASLVAFRIAFGAIMVWEAWRYLSAGWVREIFIAPPYHFTYPFFGWVEPWPGEGMILHFWALGVLAACIAVGFLYRLGAALFCVGFTYVFLLEQAHYLNHFYLVCLMAFLMILAPAHRAHSVDAWLRPSLRSQTAPAWALWMLRGQIAVVYFFGGIAKLNRDWLYGWPLRQWMPGSVDLPLVAPLFDTLWLAVLFSWCGLLLDLFIVPALLWRRTRPFAFAAALFFHLTNSEMFTIGIFPWFAIAATTLFFAPDWPRRLLRRLRLAPPPSAPARTEPAWTPGRRAVATLLSVHFAIQVLVPLRHFLYPGNPSWTEEGHPFAWHMKLRGKQATCGFYLRDPDTGQSWEAETREYLHPRQYRKMCSRPYLIHQFAHHLADLARENGHPRVEVRALAIASLNGRNPQPLIEPTLDLAAEPIRPFRLAPWILPLEGELGEAWTLPTAADALRWADREKLAFD